GTGPAATAPSTGRPVTRSSAPHLADLVGGWCRELDRAYGPRRVPVSARTAPHVRTTPDPAAGLTWAERAPGG
ncbi:hypothetical protein, partial [Streptomyces rameus]|uniref:hypothetical protein n=1 Tax=Streptomyces rameus TaxID=68261 RepID=UPI003CD067B7